MPFTVTMPKLSPTMEEGTIAKWHKKVGDKVEADELLVEVATDKATVEYNALDEGYLRKILVPDGGHAVVNQPIAIFTEKANESIEGYKPEGIAASARRSPKKKKKPLQASRQRTPTPAVPRPCSSPPLSRSLPWKNMNLNSRQALPRTHRRIAAGKKLAKEKGLDLTTVKGQALAAASRAAISISAQPDQTVAFGKREMPTDCSRNL